MTVCWRRCGVALLALFWAGCQPEETAPALTERRVFAMGTWVDMAWPNDADPALGGEIQALLSRAGRDLYAYGDGELGQINANLANGDTLTVSPELRRLLLQGRDWHARTQGRLDPGIGALVRLWGFMGEPAPRAAPEDAEIAAILSGATIAHLRIDGDEIQTQSKDLIIDLAAYAKGYVVDLLIERLREAGVNSGFINAGGDLRALGRRPGGGAWRIAVQHPRQERVLGVIELAPGQAAFTSGDYARFYFEGGTRRHHILDPRNGKPVTHTQSITVLADSGILADAAATALFVAGPDWPAVAKSLGMDRVLRVDAGGALFMTPQMATQFTPSEGIEADIIGP